MSRPPLPPGRLRMPDLETVATPALVLEGATLAENVRAMAERARAAGAELWPHTKTHKSRAIAALQREYGISGLTTATVREAECFVEGGFEDVLVAYPPVGDWRLERLCALARRARVRVVVDNGEVARALDDACRRSGVRIPYLWEVDCGVGRCGTAPGAATAEIAAPIAERTRWAVFDGVMAFGGHAYGARAHEEIERAAAEEGAAVRETVAALAELGVETRTTSVGTTPTAHELEREGPVGEIRPGNYVFYDATQVALGVVPSARCALTVLATVVSRPDPRRLILDAGSKALAAERLTPLTPGFGFVLGHPELVVERLFEEHAIVVSEAPSDVSIGARLRIVPNHACACANLHERMLVVSDGAVEDVWPVDARGWESERGDAVTPRGVRAAPA
ncbi:MAG: alanine racemase [Actinomycetota bacterium]|nr:alanine racemase [Actinomycetota bacterium]